MNSPPPVQTTRSLVPPAEVELEQRPPLAGDHPHAHRRPAVDEEVGRPAAGVARVVEEPDHRPAIGEGPHPAGLGAEEAQPVEQGLGAGRVVLGEGAGERLVVVRRAGARGDLRRQGEAAVLGLDDLLAVDRQRQSPAEVALAQDLRLPRRDRVAGRPARPREVRRDQVVAAARGVPAQHVEAALAAPARVLGVVGEAEVPGLHAHPAGGDVERDEVRPADLELHPVHVRQLPARLVHGEVEGVPLEDDGRVVAVLASTHGHRCGCSGFSHWRTWPYRAGPRACPAPRVRTRGRPGRPGRGGSASGSARRVEHLVAVRGDEVAEQAVGRFEAEAENGLAHALEGGHLGPVEHPPRRQAAGDRGVGHLALPPVRDVVGGEGRTVRPAVPSRSVKVHVRPPSSVSTDSATCGTTGSPSGLQRTGAA